MKVVHINSAYPCGGSGRIAMELHTGFQSLGHESELLLGSKSDYPGALELGHESRWPKVDRFLASRISRGLSNKWVKKWIKSKNIPSSKVDEWKNRWASPTRAYHYYRGLENFSYQGVWDWMQTAPKFPDIIHLHDLFTSFFDLRSLQELTQKARVIWTLHNEWPFTGLCHYTLGCDRWQKGCGSCPHLHEFSKFSNPLKDRTRENLKRKKEIYQKSKLTVVTPSQWLLDRVQKSILSQSLQSALVIRNGVDVSRFRQGPREEARLKLGLHLNEKIILFVGNRVKTNQWRVWEWMRKTAREVSLQFDRIHFICVGEALPSEEEGNLKVTFIAFDESPEYLVEYYRAADLYFQLSRADNFPTTILEAMAVGLPVVSTRVGGIPEQVIHGENGFLVEPGNIQEGAEALVQLLKDDSLRERMGQVSRNRVEKYFRKEDMIDRYLKLYQA